MRFAELGRHKNKSDTDQTDNETTTTDRCSACSESSQTSDDDAEILRLLKENNQLLHHVKDYGNDDDELFVRSLVPSIKECKGDSKLILRVEMMKLIVSFKSSTVASAAPVPEPATPPPSPVKPAEPSESTAPPPPTAPTGAKEDT
ncbi:unnamed protein product [Chrysodeixis includens]|uniref:BESS domain-containing protein n=1 Tax=Chrysodeixis includens TaxID=689277 RepID=A0A9N8L5H7_CHRIL|nr:unnamed protein product [Chrysodeixis includens]